MDSETARIAYWCMFALTVAWGACVGSFLNVCICRIPEGLSVVKPRSRCPKCLGMIAWYDNIPLLSFLILRWKCRKCGTRISARYFLVELLTALLFTLVFLKFRLEPGSGALGLAPIWNLWLVPAYWLAVSGLILGTFVDLEHMIIPDRVSLGGIVAGLVLSAALPEIHGQDSTLQALMRSAFGASLGFSLLWAIARIGTFIFKKDAMGMGDVKLLGAVGAFAGWRGVLFCIMVSSLLGSIAGITMVLCGGKEMRSRIPYGPYIAIAAVIWILWGASIWQWYVDMLMPPL